MRSVEKMTTKSTKTNPGSLRQKYAHSGKLRSKNVLLSVVLLWMLFLFSPITFAQQAQIDVRNKDNEVVFRLDFYGQAQGSTANFSQAQINAITEAAQYWVDMLKAHGKMPNQLDQAGEVVTDAAGNPVTQPVIFSIYYRGDDLAGNANAGTNGYVLSAQDNFNISLPEALLTDGVYTAPITGGHATINVGSGWNAISGNQSQSGRVLNDLTPVLIHEMGHALGIASSATYEIDPITEIVSWKFPDTLSRYDSRLRDNNGNSASVQPGQPGKEIGYDDTANHSKANTIFDMGDPLTPYLKGNPSHPTFVGKNTLELWYGKPIEKLTNFEKNSGVPVTGYTYDLGWNFPYLPLQWQYNPGGTMSHIDTANSVMSWQDYRNYPGFIEAEMAMMQDIGYTVERRDFFGKSFYVNGDGTPFYNSATFGYWDAAKQGYDMSRPNTSAYAMGAHLFAKDLNVIQTGSIWANGPGSAGIRIDGSNNKLTVASGTNIFADGLNGIGLLTAYGKNHSIILQNGSHVHATGNGGTGVSFNFGEDLLGSDRGSYYYMLSAVATDPSTGLLYGDYIPLEELNGALVKSFDVSGKITGSKSGEIITIQPWWGSSQALHEDLIMNGTEIDGSSGRRFALGAAIYIDESAHVETINIMNGAEIHGDILSYYQGNASAPLDRK
ncbi:MAG: hypothetical protein LBQ50_13825, partial [Planctomycetaceae bacterium]|nr:hypothetical protein [Planctomycetaceae bacterium]